MNKLKITMSSMLLPALLLTGCQSNSNGASNEIIEKPVVEVKNGMLTPEILEAFGRISEAIVSPDATKVAYTLGYEDVSKNASNSEIYMMNIDGSNQTRLTRTAGSEFNLRWIDGGNKLAFLAKDDATNAVQLFVMNPDGTGRKCLSNVEKGMTCFEISPNGDKVIFGSLISVDGPNKELFEGLPLTTGRLVNDLMYKHWDEWVTEIPHPFLADFSFDREIQNIVDIMEGEPFECPMKPFGGAETFAWSPDGKYLVYTSRKLTGMEYAKSTDSNLYLYDLSSKKTECLTQGMLGYDTDPKFSPDGKSLAWLSMQTPGYESDKKRIMLLDMETREKRDLTADWDFGAEGLAWSPNGQSIVFNTYYLGTEPIFRMNVIDCKIDTVASGVWDYVGVNPVGDDKVLALRHSMLRPSERYYKCKW